MNLAKKYGPIAANLSIGQYSPPACYELAGKRFDLVMDIGYDTGDAVLWISCDAMTSCFRWRRR
jgi:hypothetical protein